MEKIQCPYCKGDGEFVLLVGPPEGDPDGTWVEQVIECGRCNGTGMVPDTRCPYCGQLYDAADAAQHFIDKMAE